MDTFSDSLLSAINRLSERLGPLTALIDTIVDCIAPKATAQASCPPSEYCYIKCSSTCCANCGGDAKYYEYAWYGTNCLSYCVVNCTNFC